MRTGKDPCVRRFRRPRGGREQSEQRTHDVALVIGDLRGGGTQRVLTRLASEWATRGLRVCVVTLAESTGDKYQLHPAVDRVALNSVGESRSKIVALISNARRLFRLRGALRLTNAPVIVSFLTTTNVLTILAAAGLAARVVVSERNDPEKQQLRWPWPLLRRLVLHICGFGHSQHSRRAGMASQLRSSLQTSARTKPRGANHRSLFVIETGKR